METNNETTYPANDVAPAYPVHPGGILGEELKARGISQKKFAETIGLQATHLSALIHGTRSFTPSVAAKIASGLEEIPANVWIKLQEQYNLDCLRKRRRLSSLVHGYDPVGYAHQPAYLADPSAARGERTRVVLTIPEADKELLEGLASRMGWLLQ